MNNWSQEQTLLFLELFQGEPIIWNSQNKGHKDKKKVYDAWMRLATLMNVPMKELKKKKESLLATYRGYRRKVQVSIKSGAGTEDVYHPIWFAYDIMHQFLGPIFKCQSTINTEQRTEERDAEDSVEIMNETSDIISVDLNELNTTPEQRKTIRRRYNPPELQNASKQMTEAFNTLNNAINQNTTEVEDECDIFGKLVAKKLKKLPENKREELMFEIHSLFRSTGTTFRPPSVDSKSVINLFPSVTASADFDN